MFHRSCVYSTTDVTRQYNSEGRARICSTISAVKVFPVFLCEQFSVLYPTRYSLLTLKECSRSNYNKDISFEGRLMIGSVVWWSYLRLSKCVSRCICWLQLVVGARVNSWWCVHRSMSALSTPGGGGTTAQSKPTSGKQKYQKLDINSLYCVNRVRILILPFILTQIIKCFVLKEKLPGYVRYYFQLMCFTPTFKWLDFNIFCYKQNK